MNNLVRVSFLVFISFATVISCSSSSYEELTEELVRSVISKLDDATESRDATVISDALSEDASIVITINMEGQTQVFKPSKQEYIVMLEEGWAAASNYEYKRTNLKIKMEGDKAMITAIIRESMSVRGRKLNTRTHERVTMELINGMPLITKVVGSVDTYIAE